MAVPVEDQEIRPRAAWYAVPAVLWLIGLTLFVIALIAIAKAVTLSTLLLSVVIYWYRDLPEIVPVR